MVNKFKKLILLFPKRTIFVQLVLFTALISIVPIIFISFFISWKITNIVTEELINSNHQITIQYTANIENRLLQYRDSLEQIANNTIILNSLLDNNVSNNPYIKGNTVTTEVNKSLSVYNNEFRNCMVYSNIASNKIYGGRIAMVNDESNEIRYINNKAYLEDHFIFSSFSESTQIISLVQNIEYIDYKAYQRQYIGFVKLDIYSDIFFIPTEDKKYEMDIFDVIVLDDEENIIYSSNTNYNGYLTDISFEEILNSKTNYFRDTMIFANNDEVYNLKYIFLFDNSQLDGKKAEVFSMLLPVFIIVMILILIIAFVFTKGFSMRVSQLVDKIKLAEEGNFIITHEIDGNDEIAILDKQFNQMLIKLDKLIKKNYIQQLSKKEVEFRNLQLQINPHFLYNTLETISSIAAINKVFLICDLCDKLGDNFRYSLGKNYGEFVTVLQELQHIKNYIFIQKTRFGNKFEVYYNIEPEVENKRILRFILQPIVENAIVHGLSNSLGKGALEISIGIENECIIIKIEDDGVGMTLERVGEITKYIDDTTGYDNTQNIGIKNVNQRIKLVYGEDYGLTIKSYENQGSCFIILLPIMQ